MSPHSTSIEAIKDIRQIPLFYDSADSDASARRLLFALSPDWEHDEGNVELIRFTEGITNTVRHYTPLHHRSLDTELWPIAPES